MSERRVRVLVSGRVQGVWFRESTRQQAESLGLAGFVRNLPDGRVEACFQGEAAAVEAALAFVQKGPPLARVDAVETCDEPTEGPERGFRVRS